ncbi:MAG: hypothetical protein WBE71_15125, partial [Xanthobacteraceae bacterium]
MGAIWDQPPSSSGSYSDACDSIGGVSKRERAGGRDPLGRGARRAEGAAGAAPDISFRISTDLAVVVDEWRQFERVALLTPFRTYEWPAAWQRHIGMRNGVVIGRFADGTIAFILPLAIDPRHTFKRLCWLGQDLCDYKAPLLARDFMARVAPENSGHCGGSSKRKCNRSRRHATTGSNSR